MSTTDPWMHMIYQVCPTYDDLKYMMNNFPKIKIVIEGKRNSWNLSVVENRSDFGHDEGGSYSYQPDNPNYDFIVNWSEQELSTWKNCRRIAWNMWQFKYKQDAEKFSTLFYLKWAQ